MNDITLVYYTANLVDQSFAERIRKELLAFGLPIISVSQKPIDFGENYCVGEIGACAYNVYRQILLGAKHVKTKYMACCEDDTLYTKEHLSFRPTDDGVFYYNVAKWNIGNRRYFYCNRRKVMSMCIASTSLMIDTLETRFEKYPVSTPELSKLGEPGLYDAYFGLPIVQNDAFESAIPTVTFRHACGLSGLHSPNFRSGNLIEKVIPYWGSSSDLWRKYHA